MAVKLLQVLVLGVIAAAAVDDVPVTWVSPPRGTLPCRIPDADRIQSRRPPPPLEGERQRNKPYLWTRDGEELRNTNGSLEVSRRKDPEGVYQCAVRHQGGLVLGYPVHLRYAYIGKFSVHPANATAWRGQPFALSCDIPSGPPAAISWLKDGDLLPDDARYQLVNNQLIITEVKYKDAGLYRCRASNVLANRNRTSHGGHLQVEEPPEELPPSFLPVHHEASLVVEKGNRVILPCPMLGNPRPQLIWEHTPPGAGSRTGELEPTDQLFVSKTIGVDEAGVYVCRVVGHNLVKTFNVTVATAVNVTHGPESRQAVRASTVRFNCTASGVPPARVIWYKDGQPLKLTGRFSVVPYYEDKRLLQLLIRSVTSEDAGVYQCFASNGVSLTSAWATLNMTGGEAAAPRDVRCWPAGARDVLVRWADLPDVLAYTVQYTQLNASSSPGQPILSPEDLVTVKSPLTPYSFQVRAYLSTGNKNTANLVSAMSDSVTCQGQGVPIKLSKAGNDSVLVSWREFYMKNPGVVQWILQHKAENSSNEHNITLDGHVYNYTLKVEPEEPRQVRVLGTRLLPWLHQNLTLVPWTASSAAGHHLPPGEVRAVPEDVELIEVNPRNFTVRWRCEEEALTYSFMVCTRKVGGNEDCIETYVKSAMILNLQPNTDYEVKVQARLPGQTLGGDFSAPVPVTTPPEGQQKFINLTYKFINETAVRVSWVNDLKEYTVRYTYEYSLPLHQWTTVDAVGNTVLLTDLDPTKEVKVIVEGREPFSLSPLLTIPVHIPEAQDLQYEYTTDGVEVSWRGDGPRLVRYSQNLTQPLQAWTTVYVTDTSVQITGLEPSLHTFVMVAAPGESARSQVLTIKPRPASTTGPSLFAFGEENYKVYLGLGITFGILIVCAAAIIAVFMWRKRKRGRSPRRRPRVQGGTVEEEGEEMRNIGDRLANGVSSKDAGEPLLNGHVHITENPTQSKTPNGKVRKGHYEDAFDVTRFDDADVTLDTVLEPDTSASTTYHLLDTSRREFDSRDISANDSFTKLPDDNMNSELDRGPGFELDNSKVLPTLQPNG